MLQPGSGRSGRIVDMHEAEDALALTDNWSLLLPHLITNIALARIMLERFEASYSEIADTPRSA